MKWNRLQWWCLPTSGWRSRLGQKSSTNGSRRVVGLLLQLNTTSSQQQRCTGGRSLGHLIARNAGGSGYTMKQAGCMKRIPNRPCSIRPHGHASVHLHSFHPGKPLQQRLVQVGHRNDKQYCSSFVRTSMSRVFGGDRIPASVPCLLLTCPILRTTSGHWLSIGTN